MDVNDGAVGVLLERERQLWLLGLVLYGVGDTVTTIWGLSDGNVAEMGPIAAPILEAHGRLSFVGVKAAVLAFFLGAWSVLRTPGRAAVPLALVVGGATVTVWNLFVILLA